MLRGESSALSDEWSPWRWVVGGQRRWGAAPRTHRLDHLRPQQLLQHPLHRRTQQAPALYPQRSHFRAHCAILLASHGQSPSQRPGPVLQERYHGSSLLQKVPYTPSHDVFHTCQASNGPGRVAPLNTWTYRVRQMKEHKWLRKCRSVPCARRTRSLAVAALPGRAGVGDASDAGLQDVQFRRRTPPHSGSRGPSVRRFSSTPSQVDGARRSPVDPTRGWVVDCADMDAAVMTSPHECYQLACGTDRPLSTTA